MAQLDRDRRINPAWAENPLLNGVAGQLAGSTNVELLKNFKDHLAEQGWTIERTRPSEVFDLYAHKGEEQLFVEAKAPKLDASWDSLVGKVIAYATDPLVRYALLVPSSSDLSVVPDDPNVKVLQDDEHGSFVELKPSGERAPLGELSWG